jgi:hypothetical protein
MVHKNLRQKAFKLRSKGKSYSEIKSELKIPKSTLSTWFGGIKLPLSVRRILDAKARAPRERLMRFNRKRTRFIQSENLKIRQGAAKEIKKFSRYELLLIGASLYWAEGYNRQERIRSPYLSFGNSNPQMVVLFLRFLKEVMGISDDALRPAIQIHKNVSARTAVRFWARITGLPERKFRITHQTSIASRGKRPRNSLPYGTFKLDVRGRQNFFKVKGWIDGLIKRTSR